MTDANTTQHFTSATAVNLTVPPNSSVDFPVDIQVFWRQYGAGQITFVAGSGVTIRSRGGATKSFGQYSEGVLTKIGTDEWINSGDITT